MDVQDITERVSDLGWTDIWSSYCYRVCNVIYCLQLYISAPSSSSLESGSNVRGSG